MTEAEAIEQMRNLHYEKVGPKFEKKLKNLTRIWKELENLIVPEAGQEAFEKFMVRISS